MAFRVICVALLFPALSAAGCGTVANLTRANPEDGRIPFGGVRQDVACLRKAVDGVSGAGAHPESESEHYSHVALTVFCAADLPFSLIGDLVTWPYAVAYSVVNRPIPTPPVTLADPPAPPPVSTPPATRPMPIPPAAPPPAAGTPKALPPVPSKLP